MGGGDKVTNFVFECSKVGSYDIRNCFPIKRVTRIFNLIT